MKIAVSDIEADNLRVGVTTIWCIVVQDCDTNEIFEYGPDDLVSAYEKLNEYDAVVFHNGIAYDVPVIERLIGEKHGLGPCSFDVIDTLCLSRLYFADKEQPPCFGNHSLGNWGRILGFPKTDHDDWSRWSQEMQDYCVNDVLLTRKIYEVFKEGRNKAGDWDTSVRLEYSVTHILGELMANGYKLNRDNVDKLVYVANTKKNEALEELRKRFPDEVDEVELKTPQYYLDPDTDTTYRIKGDAPAKIRKRLVPGPNKIRRDVTEFNPNSGPQVAKQLMDMYGWEPTEFTKKGNIKTDNDVLSNLPYEEADLILDFRLYAKKESQAEEWLRAVQDDGRIYGSVISNGAPTGRMSHNTPNMAQIPKVGNPLGLECRLCFEPRAGWKQVGADASGLELRMLASAMEPFDGGEYARLILEDDIHTHNQHAAGLETRDQAKTFIYALIYGAGNAKLGKIVGAGDEVGARLRADFFKAIPALQRVINQTVREWNKYDYIRGLDGRRLPVRSEHAILNTKLQSDGAIIMKTALCLLYNKATDIIGPHPKWHTDPAEWAMLAVVHDEFQAETEPQHADTLGQLMVDSIIEAGTMRGIRMPLDGEYKIGNSWADCH